MTSSFVIFCTGVRFKTLRGAGKTRINKLCAMGQPSSDRSVIDQAEADRVLLEPKSMETLFDG